MSGLHRGGVRIPEGQRQQELVPGRPKTLQHVQRAELVGVQYTDDAGKAHVTTCMLIGGKLYQLPNGEEWSAKLTGAAGWLQDSVKERLGVSTAEDAATQAAKVPEADGVDIA